MLLIELVTKEFPYHECKHTMEIYQKVTQGNPPESLKKVTNPYLLDLITQSIQVNPNQRPSAEMLLKHQFFSV